MSKEESHRAADKIVKELADEGRLIQGGWLALVLLAGLDKASEVQRREMRDAFFLGAQHLFSSILTVLEEGKEATEADLAKLTAIHLELEGFIDERLKNQKQPRKEKP